MGGCDLRAFLLSSLMHVNASEKVLRNPVVGHVLVFDVEYTALYESDCLSEDTIGLEEGC